MAETYKDDEAQINQQRGRDGFWIVSGAVSAYVHITACLCIFVPTFIISIIPHQVPVYVSISVCFGSALSQHATMCLDEDQP